MEWWKLQLLIWFFWILWVLCGTVDKGIENIRDPLPDGSRRGFSWMPIIPVLPLAFWGVAELIDIAVAPWGSLAIGLLHAILGAYALAYFILRAATLRTLAKNHSA
ncbi:MAG: hypothetical protein JSS27_00230 [Planctomycetes bacterium]|nr:hypothetical protein [Planctomycetota bacterium]